MYFSLSNGVSNGVINYIINKNFQTLIFIISSGQYYEDMPASGLSKGNVFYTERNNNYGQWILFEFTKNYIDFEGYSLMSKYSSECPSYWKIEVSQDGNQWVLASTKSEENTYTPGKNYSTALIKRVKYIKMTQTGPGWPSYNNNYVLIDRIDFFGKFYAQTICTCRRNNRRNEINMLSLMIIICYSKV